METVAKTPQERVDDVFRRIAAARPRYDWQNAAILRTAIAAAIHEAVADERARWVSVINQARARIIDFDANDDPTPAAYREHVNALYGFLAAAADDD